MADQAVKHRKRAEYVILMNCCVMLQKFYYKADNYQYLS